VLQDLGANTREINGLQTPANLARQHGLKMAVRSPFAFAGSNIARMTSPVALNHQSDSNFRNRAKSF
jgi:hypothetical protein